MSRHSVSVNAPPERAFAAFVEELHAWWPPEYTWSGDVLEEIAIEPRQEGRCFERGPHGFHCDWGRVTVFEPPHRLVFTWQISAQRAPQPDPGKASEVEVTVSDDGRVELEHRGFERHGPDADGYRAALDSPQGWPYILGRYAAHVGAA